MEKTEDSSPETLPLILIADDDPLIRKFVSLRLKSAGYWVICTENGRDCVAQYEATAGIALIILDCEMPELDGIEVFRHIRALDPQARFILSTGGHNNVEFKALADASAVWLPKPFTPRDLLAAVDAVLNS